MQTVTESIDGNNTTWDSHDMPARHVQIFAAENPFDMECDVTGPGWQGSGDISDLFKRSLSLGLPDGMQQNADVTR